MLARRPRPLFVLWRRRIIMTPGPARACFFGSAPISAPLPYPDGQGGPHHGGTRTEGDADESGKAVAAGQGLPKSRGRPTDEGGVEERACVHRSPEHEDPEDQHQRTDDHVEESTRRLVVTPFHRRLRRLQ